MVEELYYKTYTHGCLKELPYRRQLYPNPPTSIVFFVRKNGTYFICLVWLGLERMRMKEIVT